jgi:hypothetical protein
VGMRWSEMSDLVCVTTRADVVAVLHGATPTAGNYSASSVKKTFIKVRVRRILGWKWP